MKIPRKIFVLVLVFISLFALSIWVAVKSKPLVKESTPLGKMEEAKFGKIEIRDPSRSVSIEKKKGNWVVTSPIEDLADVNTMDQLVSTLRSFTIGTIISEKKEKYPNFDLDEVKATNVKVFETGKEKPALDMWVGKQAVGYGSTYVRFANEAPVYIADNLPNWTLLKPVDEFRARKIIPLNIVAVTRLDFDLEKQKMVMVKSSTTWTREGSTRTLDEGAVSTLLNQLESWRSQEFIDKSDAALKTAFQKPVLSLTVATPSESKRLVIGAKKVAPKGEPDPNLRYLTIDGRTTVLVVGSALVDDVISKVKVLSK